MLELLNEPAFVENCRDRGVRTVAEAEGYIAEKILPSYVLDPVFFAATAPATHNLPTGGSALESSAPPPGVQRHDDRH